MKKEDIKIVVQNKSRIIYALLGLIILLLLYRGCSIQNNLNTTNSLYESATDSLKNTRNELGQQVSKITVLEAYSSKQLQELNTKDKNIVELKKLVDNYKGKILSAVVTSTNTTNSGITKAVIVRDTIIVNEKELVYESYNTNWDDKWSKGKIKATKDSIFRDIKIRNDYEFTVGYEKEGIFKKRKSVITMINLNPNTETEELRTFVVKDKPKRFGVGAGVCYGIGLSSLKPEGVVGISVTYNLISF